MTPDDDEIGVDLVGRSADRSPGASDGRGHRQERGPKALRGERRKRGLGLSLHHLLKRVARRNVRGRWEVRRHLDCPEQIHPCIESVRDFIRCGNDVRRVRRAVDADENLRDHVRPVVVMLSYACTRRAGARGSAGGPPPPGSLAARFRSPLYRAGVGSSVLRQLRDRMHRSAAHVDSGRNPSAPTATLMRSRLIIGPGELLQPPRRKSGAAKTGDQIAVASHQAPDEP